MRSSSLRDLVVWTRLKRVNEVGEKNSVIDEEDRCIDPNNILSAWSVLIRLQLSEDSYQNCLRQCRTW